MKTDVEIARAVTARPIVDVARELHRLVAKRLGAPAQAPPGPGGGGRIIG
jgi:hypothetical protein